MAVEILLVVYGRYTLETWKLELHMTVTRKSAKKLPERAMHMKTRHQKHRPFRKMATGLAHGATFRSRGADSESSHLICILQAADGSNF